MIYESDVTKKNVSSARLHDKIEFLATFRDLDPNMPVAQILFLLAAARQPDSSMKQLAESVNVPTASASRYLTALTGGRPAVGLAGLGLLDAVENPRDRKSKIISLTDSGKELLSRVI